MGFNRKRIYIFKKTYFLIDNYAYNKITYARGA